MKKDSAIFNAIFCLGVIYVLWLLFLLSLPVDKELELEYSCMRFANLLLALGVLVGAKFPQINDDWLRNTKRMATIGYAASCCYPILYVMALFFVPGSFQVLETLFNITSMSVFSIISLTGVVVLAFIKWQTETIEILRLKIRSLV